MLPKLKLLPLSLAISTALLTGCLSDDDNNAPVLTGDILPVVAENTVLVGEYTATDIDNDNITLTLTGADSELFTLVESGVLSFNTAPDFESGDIGPYKVTITATDDGKGNLSTDLDISISVGDEKDTPSLAVVQAIAPDWSNSYVAYIDPNNQQVDEGYYIKDLSDYTLSSYKTDVYHIGRSDIDTIDKYNAADKTSRDSQVWSFFNPRRARFTKSKSILVSFIE